MSMSMDRYASDIRHIPMTRRLRRLPISENGFPVPWFVSWPGGKPDFRNADPVKLAHAIRQDLCWLCGQTLGRYKTFVIKPMGAISRHSAEPPAHRDCATYAVQACPLLRSDCVVLLWVTHSYSLVRCGPTALCRMDEPLKLQAYVRGRAATRDEFYAALQEGLPTLTKSVARDGEHAMRDFARAVEHANGLFRKMLTFEEPSSGREVMPMRKAEEDFENIEPDPEEEAIKRRPRS
jgi:hypothetical protein